MDGRTVEIIITGSFPVLAWVGWIGLIVAGSRKRPRLAMAFGAVGIIGLLGMLWASQTIFVNA